ncbi:MAG: hypothetical protein Tsb005_14050 [Gammaproteobacteria bacterium]
MKKCITLFCLFSLLLPAWATRQTHVNGYIRKNGTYVQPHYRTTPNHSRLDNWSTRGNTNPHTGKAGTRDPFALSSRHYSR